MALLPHCSPRPMARGRWASNSERGGQTGDESPHPLVPPLAHRHELERGWVSPVARRGPGGQGVGRASELPAVRGKAVPHDAPSLEAFVANRRRWPRTPLGLRDRRYGEGPAGQRRRVRRGRLDGCARPHCLGTHRPRGMCASGAKRKSGPADRGDDRRGHEGTRREFTPRVPPAALVVHPGTRPRRPGSR